MIGETIGPYRVVAPIGAGGMGAVWLAKHELLDTKVAIKILLPEVSQRTDIVQRFFDEARAAARISHPGIVKVIDFGWHAGSTAYLVMEHLEGESVAARMRRTGSFPVDRAARIVRECAITMAAAHARGIIHRDLKPDNIFLTPDPIAADGERVKILDFGIAKLLGEDDAAHPRTRSDVIMGTPAYMSPEQCRGAGGVDFRTDIYALGCVLFQLVCGRPPFDAPAPGDLIASHLREPPPIPSTIAPQAAGDIDEIVGCCLAKDPDARFKSMSALAAALTPTAEPHKVAAPVPRPAAVPSTAPEPPVDPIDTPRPDGATVATGSPVPVARGVPVAAPTTLGASAAELQARQPRWRRGVLAASLAVATLVGVTIVIRVGRSTNDRHGTTNRDATAPELDAGSLTPSSADAAAPLRSEHLDAGTSDASDPPTPIRDAATHTTNDGARHHPKVRDRDDHPRSMPRDAAVPAPPDASRQPRPARPDASAYDHR